MSHTTTLFCVSSSRLFSSLNQYGMAVTDGVMQRFDVDRSTFIYTSLAVCLLSPAFIAMFVCLNFITVFATTFVCEHLYDKNGHKTGDVMKLLLLPSYDSTSIY